MPDKSTKSVTQKLLIKSGQKVVLVNAPEDAQELLGQAPDGVEFSAGPGAQADVVLLFAHDRAELERLLPRAREGLLRNGILWVAYHKGTSAVKTDINRDSIWRYARTVGMDAVAMISVNDDWSAMRLKTVTAEE